MGYDLVCRACGRHTKQDVFRCPHCNGILDCRFDLEDPPRYRSILQGAKGFWDYRPFFPVAGERPVSLGEGNTPLVAAPRLASRLEMQGVYVKNEGMNPSGTFKDRCQSIAYTKAKEMGCPRHHYRFRRERGGRCGGLCRRQRHPVLCGGAGGYQYGTLGPDPAIRGQSDPGSGQRKRLHRAAGNRMQGAGVAGYDHRPQPQSLPGGGRLKPSLTSWPGIWNGMCRIGSSYPLAAAASCPAFTRGIRRCIPWG